MSIKKIVYGMLFMLFIVSLLSSVGTFAVLNSNQDNGKVVNYSGIVRGGSQRIIKLYLLNQPIDELTANTQKIIDGLTSGNAELGIPKPTNAAFISSMSAVDNYWATNLLPLLSGTESRENTEMLLKNSEEMFRLSDNATKAAEEFTAQGITLLKYMSLATLLLILACVIVIARIFRKKILLPIKVIEQRMLSFAQGDLTVNVEFQANNELGHLADSIRTSMGTTMTYIRDIDRAMHEMSLGNFDLGPTQPFIGDFKHIEESITRFILNISDTFGHLRESSEQVNANSEQVSNSAHSLAQGSTEQAESIERLSSSIAQIAEAVSKNALHSLKAKEIATSASDAVMSSNQQMKSLMTAMDKINSKSGEIGKIIKTIEDIAFQTNILALNAAVEAARAGAAGKGFAVVADEVRNLAGKSAEAAKSTAELIESSISSINEGVLMAGETEKELLEIVRDTNTTTEMISDISAASSEQADTLGGLSYSVEQITAVIHSNSNISEKSAAAAEELSGQAHLMKAFISKFKYKTTEQIQMIQGTLPSQNRH